MTTPQTDFEDRERLIAEEARLRFPPPYVEYSSEKQGFYFHWSKLQYVFALPDPATFHRIPVTLALKDLDAVRRYVQACKELSTYTLLNYGGGITVHWTPESESVKVETPPKETLRGFTVLFRQIHSDSGEPASFKVVRSILSSASAKAEDGHKDARMEVIKQWSRARAALLQRSLTNLAQAKIHGALSGQQDAAWSVGEGMTPLQLISLFNYGEYIHWGDRRDEHAALFKDEVGAAFAEFHFQETLIGLSHFYFGYAKLLEIALLDS